MFDKLAKKAVLRINHNDFRSNFRPPERLSWRFEGCYVLYPQAHGQFRRVGTRALLATEVFTVTARWIKTNRRGELAALTQEIIGNPQ